MKRPLLALLGVFLPVALFAQTTAVPSLIAYQGKVTDANGTLIGSPTPVNRTVTFRIWNNPSSTAPASRIYSEQQTVTIANGEFSVLIGAGSPVVGETNTVTLANAFAGEQRFLGVMIDDGTAAADPEVSPRQQIVSGAFALRAKLAETVVDNSITAANLTVGAVTDVKLASGAVTSSKIAPGAVTGAQLAPGAITADIITTSSITNSKLADSSVTTAKLADSVVTTDKLADGTVNLADLAAAVQNALCPVGTIQAYAGNTAPAGWALCNGLAVSRTDVAYSALFNVVGTRFGSLNATSFNLPDFRGRFLRGWDYSPDGSKRDIDGASRIAMNPGGATGFNLGSVQLDELDSHSHQFFDTYATMATGANETLPGGNRPYSGIQGWNNPVSAWVIERSTVSKGGSETRPINAYVNYIIKL